MGERIYVGDLQESFHYMRYKRAENSLYIYADDIVPRHITSALVMDYDTVAGGDKFGNLFMTRLPVDTSTQVRRSSAGNSGSWLQHVLAFAVVRAARSGQCQRQFCTGCWTACGREGRHGWPHLLPPLPLP